MKKASVRDLRYRFAEVEQLLREGEEIQITKRQRVIGRLVPVARPRAVERPDFLVRLRKLYKNKFLKVTGAATIAEERDRF